MRIVIDMQGAQSESRFRGIGRYSMSLSLAIARNAGEHEIYLALNAAFPESIADIREAFKGLIQQDHIRIFQIPLPVSEINPKNRLRARTSEILYEYFLEQLNPDIVLITSLFDEGYHDSAIISVGKISSTYKTAAILYDLIPFLNPTNYLPEKNIYDYYMRRIDSLKKVDILLSISESSKQEAIEALDISESKIFNISTAVDNSFQKIDLTPNKIKELHQKYGITRKLVMYAPGGFDIRKNFEKLIHAYSYLPQNIRKTHQLVIVSKVQDDNRKKLNDIAHKAGLLRDELILTGYVSNEELISLYSTTTLFVFPSEHEGFGLPVLEAMACGAPVIGSNTTSIPEVIGKENALFQPNSSNSIATKIQEVLENDLFKEELKKHAKTQIKKFSWDISAKTAMESLHKLNTQDTDTDTDTDTTNILKHISNIYRNISPPENDLCQIASSLAFNIPNNSKQLLLDISVLVQVDAKSGIQRVVRSLLSELFKNPPQRYSIQPIYYDGQQYRYATKFISKFLNKADTTINKNEVVDFMQDDIYLSLDLNAHLVNEVHSIHKYLQTIGIKVYFIIYDILFVKHKEWWVDDVSITFNKWLKSIIEVSTALICISDAVANEVTEWIEENPPNRLSLPQVKNFHLGADVANSLPSKGFLKNSKLVLAQLISNPSFLMVGTIEPRKGHKQTLDAFEILWAEGLNINLVIVGKEGWLVDELIDTLRQHPELNKRLLWLEGISDEYLEKVYETSTCLIAASEGEGFGLPLIEAAQKKIPIIARDIPVFREVAGEYAYYFINENKPSILVSTIKQWLLLYKSNNHPKSDDLPWLTWKESTKQLLKSLQINDT